MAFRNNYVCLLLLLVCVLYAEVGCSMEDQKRLLLEEDYGTMLARLNNLTKEVEALKRAEIGSLQPVAFMAFLTKAVPGQNHQIIFDDVHLNLGNAYHVTHGNFIAPINGLYLFSITACSIDDHVIVLELMKNGAVVGKVLAGDSRWRDCNTGVFLQTLSVGDDVYTRHETAGDFLESSLTYSRPSFIGVLLHSM